MTKILNYLKITQQKTEDGIEKYRMNPYNPLSYLVFILLSFLGILDGLKINNIRPIKINILKIFHIDYCMSSK